MTRFSRFIILALSITALAFSTFAKADDAVGQVGAINMYGGEWSNSWRGGVLFSLDSMPAGISYFTFRKEDVAFDTFLSALLYLKASQGQVIVKYDPANNSSSGYTAVLAIVAP